MKPLVTNKKMLTWLCVCPVDKNTSKWKEITFIILTINIMSILVTALIGSGIFVVELLTVNLIDSMYALSQVFVLFNLLYTFMVLYYKRLEVEAIFDGLSDIYKEGKFSFVRSLFYRHV